MYVSKYYQKHLTICDPDPEEENIYEGLLTLQKFPKKTHLLREGEICQFEGFIKEGCVRTYYLDENGFEVTLLFAVEDWWITDIDSFNNRTPSKIFMKPWKIPKFIC
jgi:CRP-like cAMP-binding protein